MTIKALSLPLFFAAITTYSCTGKKNNDHMQFTEIQLTHNSYGHFLNSTQVFSADDRWIVYDTRNDDGGIGVTGSIEMVNTATGEIKLLYRTAHQTEFGPGVGAATFSPVANRVLFIHGIRNASQQQPYGFSRRTGVSVDVSEPLNPVFMDARNIRAPYTSGALRGGTHAYSWSGDGEWICFTYNDYIMEQLAKKDPTVKDLRTIAVMGPGKVMVPEDATLENNNGEKFSAVVAVVSENPTPGSDEIDKAFDEGWVGRKGYRKADGEWQTRAVAFQGNVKNEQSETITEIFVTDIPDDITRAAPGKPLEGTDSSRPNIPLGCKQRRVTHTKHGVQGPRHWLKSLSDGSMILFLSKDDNGIVQVFGVSPNGGRIEQVSFNDFPVEGPINISPDDKFVSYVADNSVFITGIQTHQSHRLIAKSNSNSKPEGAVIWSNNGKMLAYNRRIEKDGEKYVQIFLLKNLQHL